jgi:periplasmic protein CpxP/Spy
MKSIKILILLCITLLAVGAFAIQYPGGASPGSMQPGQSPQMRSPAQSAPGAAQPGQPPAVQPDQQPQQQQAGRPSIDDQVKVLTQELNLSSEQQARMKSILEDQHQQATAISNDGSVPREEKIQKIRSLRENTITRARSMLNDDQKKKLDAMLQETERLHQQQPGQNSAPSSAGPGNSGTSSPSSTSPGNNTPMPPTSNRPPR